MAGVTPQLARSALGVRCRRRRLPGRRGGAAGHRARAQRPLTTVIYTNGSALQRADPGGHRRFMKPVIYGGREGPGDRRTDAAADGLLELSIRAQADRPPAAMSPRVYG